MVTNIGQKVKFYINRDSEFVGKYAMVQQYHTIMVSLSDKPVSIINMCSNI